MAKKINFELRKLIAEQLALGKKHADIGRKAGVSRQRIGQIVHGYKNMKGMYHA